MQQPASSSTSVVGASDVGPNIASDSLTRQDNTTAYQAGEIICAMAGDPLAPVPLVFTAARANGGTGQILRAVCMSPTVDTGLDTILLYLFTAAPTMANDNAAFATALTNCIGVIPLTLQPAIASGTIWQSAAGVQFAYACGAAVTTLWGVAVAGDGWTPTAEQVLEFRLHLDRN